jgi:hypothetical protein
LGKSMSDAALAGRPPEVLPVSRVDEEFGSYKARVKEARLRGADDVIYNTSVAHAAILVEELFNSASERVGILCRNLNGEAYALPEVIAAAQKFLDHPKATLTLLIETEIDQHHAFLREVAHDPRYRNQVTLRSPVDLPAGAGFNFMVADRRGYRYEEDANVPNAIACFNAPDVAGPMDDLIEKIAKVATLQEARIPA